MKTLSNLKFMLFTLIILNLSNGIAATPSKQLISSCSNKIEKILISYYQTLGYSKNVSFIDKPALLSFRHYKNGSVVGAYSTPPLGDAQQDGYFRGTGATVLVGFSKNSCQILEIKLSTGYESKFEISVDEDPFDAELIE